MAAVDLGLEALMPDPLISAVPNGNYPNVAEIDMGRQPILLIRVVRLGGRHDRLILTVTPGLLTVALNWEGDDLGEVRRVVSAIELGPVALDPDASKVP